MNGFACALGDARCRARQLCTAWRERERGPIFAFGSPRRAYVGLGVADELVVGASDGAADPWEGLDAFVGAHRERGVVGYFGYGLHGPEVAKGPAPFAELLVPEHLVLVRPDSLEACWGTLPVAREPSGCRCGTHRVVTARELDDLAPRDARYEQALRRVLAWTRGGEGRRLTIARRVPLPEGVDLLATLHASQSPAPSVRSFHLETRHGALTGTSPELLAEGTIRRFRSHKLSGTYPRAADRARDEALREAFLRDPKIADEHASSRAATLASLAGIGRASAAPPACLDLPGLRHLESVVDTEVHPPRSLARCLRAALPSGARPRDEGLRLLAEVEDASRGPYYGLVGYCLGAERFELAQVLRTVFRREGSTYTWVGAAVTAESTVEGEYEETRIKLGDIHLALRPDASARGE